MTQKSKLKSYGIYQTPERDWHVFLKDPRRGEDRANVILQTEAVLNETIHTIVWDYNVSIPFPAGGEWVKSLQAVFDLSDKELINFAVQKENGFYISAFGLQADKYVPEEQKIIKQDLEPKEPERGEEWGSW